MPIVKSREYRNANLLEKKDDFIVDGYATTFEPYKLYELDGIEYYERIDRNAFANADFSDVIFQYDHEGKVFARTSNGTLKLEIDDIGLRVSADLSKSASARAMHEEIEGGLVTKMSWAFTIEEENYNRETRTRNILKIKKVYDVSAVSIPANDGTSINARSYFDGVIEAERVERALVKKAKLRAMLEAER